MKVSWEPASNLQESVVEEFEEGADVHVEYEVNSSFGKKVHIPAVRSSKKGPSTKKTRLSESDLMNKV